MGIALKVEADEHKLARVGLRCLNDFVWILMNLVEFLFHALLICCLIIFETLCVVIAANTVTHTVYC